MLVGAKVCDLTEDLLWFVCGLYVGILMSSLNSAAGWIMQVACEWLVCNWHVPKIVDSSLKWCFGQF